MSWGYRRLIVVTALEVRHRCHDRRRAMQLLRSWNLPRATKNLIVRRFGVTASAQR